MVFHPNLQLYLKNLGFATPICNGTLTCARKNDLHFGAICSLDPSYPKRELTLRLWEHFQVHSYYSDDLVSIDDFERMKSLMAEKVSKMEKETKKARNLLSLL